MSHFVLYSCKNFTTKALAAAALGLDWSDIMIMLCEVILWLCYSYVVAAATAAVLARREAVLWLSCLRFLQLLKSPSSLLPHILPVLDSANSPESVNSETTGAVSRIRNTLFIIYSSLGSWLPWFLETCVIHHFPWCRFEYHGCNSQSPTRSFALRKINILLKCCHQKTKQNIKP